MPNNSMMMRLRMISNLLAFVLLTLALITLFISPVEPSHNSTRSDEMALLAFKNSLSLDPLNSLHNWAPHRHFCTWKGVACSSHPHRVRVVSLDLKGMALVGSISPFIGNLSFLRVLVLRKNSFHGKIPSELGRLFRLRKLRLTKNKLEGAVPSSLLGCRSLKFLSLSYNQLSGTIPSTLSGYRSLKVLSLSYNQLSGTIPSTLSGCRSLKGLSLSYNQLSGTIPSQLGLLSNLNLLYLGGNQITGTIPAFTSLSLIELDLGGNRFEGNIPSQLARLPSLQLLWLNENQFKGEIPSFIGNMSSLTSLDLSYNQLTGKIPSFIGTVSSLTFLDLSINQLTGKIPSSIGNMSYLIFLDLSNNKLTGKIPGFAGNLSSLTQIEVLVLAENRFTGEIPRTFSNCSHLRVLDLGDNQLIGHIPWDFISKLLWLEQLFLRGNKLSGEIPSSLHNCTRLQILDLSENRLSGTIPMELGKLIQFRLLNLLENQFVSTSKTLLILTALNNCSHLQTILLGGNFLSGILPSSIGKLSPKLSDLELQSNELDGNIPNEIDNLTSLTYIDLSSNNFNGAFPSNLDRLAKLERLYIHNNKLHGKIPNNWNYLKRLGLLDLSDNMLSGQIPNSLGQLPQLRDLYLHRNQLSGEIPSDLGKCLTLERLDLAHNKLIGSIPSNVAGLPNLEFYFNLSSNLLEGSLPLEMSKMVMVQAIDISHNHFSGGIPSVLSSCIALQYLNLSWNAFEGSIPSSLAKLKNLEVMDLSSNYLNGTIPMTLEDMKTLQHLNLSSNKLTGEVPKHGIFSMLSTFAIMKNPGLCGTWIGLSPCSHSKHKKDWLLKNVITPVVIVIAVVIMCCLFLGLLRRRKCLSPNPHAFGPTMISYKELVDATSGFSEANLIGTGSFGAVYKGMLKNGTCVAVKVLNLQDENAHQSFHKECDVLKRVRHRNVIRVITSCSNNEFKALVFPFMSNGSLERWLYPSEGDGCVLNLNERLRMAMEIAQGMEYLHHHCFVQVVHCDLKPSNVLLGDDMTGYLADFGISKLVFGNSMDSLSSTNALKGSIGYMAPEYGVGGKVCSNGDVYSYGILLLELLIRKRPTDNAFLHGLNLPKWVNMNFPNKITEVVDVNLLKDLSESEVPKVLECLTQLLQVGLVCANESPQERPRMTEITKRLEKIKSIFLGETRAFELPLDISTLLENTGGKGNTKVGSDQSWTSSTT